MLRLAEVAKRLNCSLSNIYNLVDSGRLPVIATGAGGRGLRVTEEDLQAFIENGRHGRRPEPWPAKSKAVKLKHLR